MGLGRCVCWVGGRRDCVACVGGTRALGVGCTKIPDASGLKDGGGGILEFIVPKGADGGTLVALDCCCVGCLCGNALLFSCLFASGTGVKPPL